MIDNFGAKFGLDEKVGFKWWLCVFPPLAFILGGLGIMAWSITDYYDMVGFGMYDEAFMEKMLWDGLITSFILIGVGLVLMFTLSLFKLFYKTGFWSVWGFTYNEETKMLSVHKFHKKREFYIGDLLEIKVANRGLNYRGEYEPVYSNRKTSFGYIHVYYNKNGKRKRLSPYGLIHGVEGVAYKINFYYEQELASKAKYTI